MTIKDLERVGRKLSLYLRHAPEKIGIRLDGGGWVDVSKLREALASSGVFITREHLDWIVDNDNKKRFAYNATYTRIRAQQGHSVDVDLGLKPSTPPDTLFHGTSDRVWEIVREQASGLRKMQRHHAHLSSDIPTARKVGARHSSDFVVLQVDAAAMVSDGFSFFQSGNGVWLVDNVPLTYLKLRERSLPLNTFESNDAEVRRCEEAVDAKVKAFAAATDAIQTALLEQIANLNRRLATSEALVKVLGDENTDLKQSLAYLKNER